MPEGPEIRYLAEMIKPKIIGKKLIDINALSKRKVNIPKPSIIKAVETKGKLLWLKTRDYYVHITFGLTGWLSFDEPEYTKYELSIGKLVLYIDDMRKFSKISVYKESKHISVVTKLGIDVLTKDFTFANYLNAMSATSMNISSFLLNQQYFCGIGNYIRNECLYIAKTNPKKSAAKLTDKQLRELWFAIRFVAFSNLYDELKNSKLPIPSDIKQIAPNNLEVPYQLRVYEQEKDPKGNKTSYSKVGQRHTYYVKSIQK